MRYLAAVPTICALAILAGCSQSPEKLIATANKYHARHKYKEASILYQKAILKDKTNAEAYYREGLNLLDERDPINAVKYLRRAIDLNPKNTDAETKLAEIYLGAYASNPERFKQLLPDIKNLTTKILKDDPNSFDGIRLEAFLALADKNLDEALKDFARANEIRPRSRDLVGWYAQALVKNKQTDQAMSLVKDMLAHDKTWSPGYDFLFLQYMQKGDKKDAEAVLRDHVANDPHNAGAIVALANYLLGQNRFDEAQAAMQNVLADRKTFPQARMLMGDFYVRARKYGEALKQYQAGASENPDDALKYQEHVVQVDLLDGQRDQAMQLAKALSEKNPDDLPVNEMYASLLMNTGKRADVDSAVSRLKALLQKHPDDAVLHMDLAHAYFDSGKQDDSLGEALEAIQQELKRHPPRQQILLPSRIIAARVYEDKGQHSKALQTTDLVLKVQPGNPDARLIRDRAWLATGQADQAEPDLEALLEQYPKMNEARIALGQLYASEKKFKQAKAEYTKAWKSTPPDFQGFLGLQTVKVLEGKGTEAVQALQQLVDKNPKQLQLRYQLAYFEAQTGLMEMNSNPEQGKAYLKQATDNYKQILKTNTNSADVWLRLGTLQRALGQYDASLASFQQAGSADPRNEEAFLYQGMLLNRLGKKKEAANAYNKVLGIDPGNTVALNNLAFINAETGGNLDQAETFAERAKQKAPNSPDISDTLGYVYYRKNLNSEALQIFKQIVKQEPTNPIFRLHLAMALLKQGDKQGAREQAERALKNATEQQQQDQIRSFVSQIG